MFYLRLTLLSFMKIAPMFLDVQYILFPRNLRVAHHSCADFSVVLFFIDPRRNEPSFLLNPAIIRFTNVSASLLHMSEFTRICVKDEIYSNAYKWQLQRIVMLVCTGTWNVWSCGGTDVIRKEIKTLWFNSGRSGRTRFATNQTTLRVREADGDVQNMGCTEGITLDTVPRKIAGVRTLQVPMAKLLVCINKASFCGKTNLKAEAFLKPCRSHGLRLVIPSNTCTVLCPPIGRTQITPTRGINRCSPARFKPIRWSTNHRCRSPASGEAVNEVSACQVGHWQMWPRIRSRLQQDFAFFSDPNPELLLFSALAGVYMVFKNFIASVQTLLNFGCISGGQILNRIRILKFEKVRKRIRTLRFKNFGTGVKSEHATPATSGHWYCCDRKSRATKLRTVAANNNRDHAPLAISLTIACWRYVYDGVILHAHAVRGESHNQRNAAGEVATVHGRKLPSANQPPLVGRSVYSTSHRNTS